MSKRALIILAIPCLAALAIGSCVLWPLVPLPPEVAVTLFERQFNGGVPEPELTDVLHRGAQGTTARVREAVLEPEQAWRAYLMVFLAQARDAPSRPVMEQIVGSEDEADAMRSTALRALYSLDPHYPIGEAAAICEQAEGTLLGKTACLIASGRLDRIEPVSRDDVARPRLGFWY